MAVVAPPAHARYVRAGTRLRTIPFSGEGDAERYRANRYRRGPQRLLHRREQGLVKAAVLEVSRRFEGGRIPRLLDVPCGFGRMLGILRPLARVCVGADLSPTQARQARRESPDTSTLAGNLLAGLPFADRCFDLVVCVRLLHHLLDPRDRRMALAELARVTRGHLLCSYYGSDVALWRLHRKTQEALALKKPRVAVVSPEDLAKDAGGAGLRIERTWDVLPMLHAHRISLFEKIEDPPPSRP